MIIARLLRRDEGIGVITALMVSFIVFTLGATWYAVSVHELDEVNFDRNRTQAIHAADAGLREATYLLATPADTVRLAADGSGVYTSGMTGSTCVLTSLQSQGNVVGEYWFRITDSTPTDLQDYVYFVEAWGWAPNHGSRQSSPKKAELEVTLDPVEAFEYGLFADTGGISAANRKEIYGDVYSAADLNISNFTFVYDNGSFPGDGNVSVYGRLEVTNGSNLYVEGRTTANGYINDTNTANVFVGDVIAVDDTAGLDVPGNDAYFKKATVYGVVRLGGTLKPTSNIGSAPYVENATGLARVPLRALPAFVWNAAEYSPTGVTYNTWADFQTYFNANKTTLSGAHYVKDLTMDGKLELQNAKFADDFVLVVDGDLEIAGAAGLATTDLPVEVVIVGNQSGSLVKVGQNFVSTNDLRFILYSKGQFQAANLTTIYGAVYATQDISNNRLTLHYRRPDKEMVVGFSFTNDTLDVVPGIWREVPPAVDGVGILNPSGSPTYYCELP